VAVVKDISSKGTGNPVDMEQIVLWDPDVIVFAPDSVYSSVAGDKTWQKLTAIKNGKYYEVPMGPYNWMGFPPSVNRYMGMIWITQLLYPDKAEYDLYKETAKYYELFYHSKLTEDQYKALVANSILKDKQ
jgi:iron complex transport system substrate-binding protein